MLRVSWLAWWEGRKEGGGEGSRRLLESIQLVLPATVQFESHLHASKDHLLAALEVDAKLDDVAIVDGERLGFGARGAQSDVVQKGARAALDIFDIPLAAFVPELAVPSAHDFALKADGCCRGHVDWDVGGVVSLGISAHANDFGAGRKRSRYGREGERRAGRPGIVEGAEPDRGQDVDAAAGAVLARRI